MSPEVYSELLQLYNDFPIITYQNKGYDNINRYKLNEEEQQADERVGEILKKHIHSFVRFQNFSLDKSGGIRVRLQYRWSELFTGVGYVPIEDFIEGFEEAQTSND